MSSLGQQFCFKVFDIVQIRLVNLYNNINIVFCFRIILRKFRSTVNYSDF